MKPVLLFLLVVTVALASVNGEKKKAAAKRTVAKQSAAAKQQTPKPADPLTVPAGAVEVEPFTYGYTDPQGKKWIYRKTPFGVSKMEESAYKPETPPPSPSGDIKAVADGDSVRFERAGPFGTYKWTKKRSELTPEEVTAVGREQPAAQHELPSGEKSK